MKDFQGETIEPGDKVVWFKGGRWDCLNIGTVVAVKKMVKIAVEKSNGGYQGSNPWAPADRVVILEKANAQ